jgi:hypothetical protein
MGEVLAVNSAEQSEREMRGGIYLIGCAGCSSLSLVTIRCAVCLCFRGALVTATGLSDSLRVKRHRKKQ